MAYATHPCTHNAPALLRAESGRAGLNVVAAAAAGLRGGCSECCGLRLVAAAQLGGALRQIVELVGDAVDMFGFHGRAFEFGKTQHYTGACPMRRVQHFL